MHRYNNSLSRNTENKKQPDATHNQPTSLRQAKVSREQNACEDDHHHHRHKPNVGPRPTDYIPR
ncbi:hypothetical protein B0T18DRAFT_399730 [Schizothecium vesticola]|uniref:Uncharacterized protein n=1 Tax=Schizothecium vesticola TaxID=314040 RepID=A0AA40FBC8_9PEZI|nr:hypothetical protein B0T18DRAFT_399730 [Schizothecium vesticola]